MRRNCNGGGLSQTAFEIARHVTTTALVLSLGMALVLPGVACADEPQADVGVEPSNSSPSLVLADNAPSSDGGSSPDEVDPIATSAVTMQQGSGEAKGYGSIAAAVADTADYHYKTNKEAYVITLNQDVSEDVVIGGKKFITINLNGNTLTSANGGVAALSVGTTKMVTVKDTLGGGEVVGNGGAAVQVVKGGKFTVSGAAVQSDGLNTVISNEGALTVSDGSVASGSGMYPTIANNGTMTVSGGAVTGGSVAVTNFGKLTVSGGSVSNTGTGVATRAVLNNSSGSLTVSSGEVVSPGTAVSANNSASVTVSGGTVSGDEYGVNAMDSVKVAISGGALASANGFALSVDNAVAATISGGDFTSADGSKAINRAFNATVTLSGGTFHVASAADICDSPVFADRHSAVEKDGKVVVEMTSPAAVVIAEDGTQTPYETFTKACSNAPAYSTVKLMEDAVLVKYSAEVNAYGVTVDLNGFSIDGTAYTGSKAALTLKTPYGDKPVEGKDSTLRLINSKPEAGGKVTAKLPVAGKAGDSTIDVPVFIGDEVELAVVNDGSDKVKLDSSAYLVYSDKTASFFSNGGFKIDAADGTQRVYGSYSSAAGHAVEGSAVMMLNDYTGNEVIYSGDNVATLDLGGHVYTYTGTQKVFEINYDNAGIVVKNGTVNAQKPLDTAGVSMLYNNGTFTMENVTMTIPGDSWGIGANGTNVDNAIVLKDSTLNVPEGLGIYFPCTGSVAIDNSVINAKHFGVQVCAGSLTITGEKTAITATGAPQAKTDGDGPIIDGAAVSVVEREGYKDLGSVSIEGGTFTASDSSKAVKTYTFNNADRVEGEWPEAGSVVTVSGGTFSDPVDEDICADGFAPQQNADGSFGVHEHQFTIAHSDADFHWTECNVCGATSEKRAHSFTVSEHDAKSHWMKCDGCDVATAKTAHDFTVVEHDAEGHWAKCEGCEAVTEKASHVFDAWESDAEGHWGTCSECGVTVDKAVHDFEWVIDKKATETEPGSKHEECTVCGFAKDAVEIPATGAGAPDDDAEGDGSDSSGSNPSIPQDRPNAPEGDVPATEHVTVLPSTGDVPAFASASIAAFALVGIMAGVALRRSRAR